jgi:hypothetical protein
MDQYMLVLDAHEVRNPALQPHAKNSFQNSGCSGSSQAVRRRG